MQSGQSSALRLTASEKCARAQVFRDSGHARLIRQEFFFACSRTLESSRARVRIVPHARVGPRARRDFGFFFSTPNPPLPTFRQLAISVTCRKQTIFYVFSSYASLDFFSGFSTICLDVYGITRPRVTDWLYFLYLISCQLVAGLN